MTSTQEDGIIHGPAVHRKIPTDSLGFVVLNSLKINANQEIVDITNGESIRFEDLLESSCKVANFLVGLGLRQGDVIAVCSHNSLHFHKPILAALYTGIVTALINHTFTENELQHALRVSQPRVVFCSRPTLTKFQHLLGQSNSQKIFVMEDLDWTVKNCGRVFAPVALNPEDATAAILFSSGTTGLSKGVMLTHANINYTCNNLIDPRLKIISDKPFVVVPFFHAYGFLLTITALVYGHRILFLEKFEEQLFLETVEKYRINFLSIVPPLMVLLAKSPNVAKYNLGIDTITIGASSLNQQMEHEVIKRLNVRSVRQAYGLTEATMGVTCVPDGKCKPGSCGSVLPGCSVKIRDPESNKTLGPNEVGEICVKGPGLMKGYYNNEEATNKTFTEDGWLLTGDLAYYDEDKYLYIVDRLKELIKYKGYQVAPAELEGLLLTHPEIANAGVVGLPDETVGEKPMAFVVRKPGSSLTQQAVVEFIKSRVSPTKQLHGGVKFLDVIPTSPSGKILRKELRKMMMTLESKL